MRVVVSDVPANEPGTRNHYCESKREMIGLLVEGQPAGADIFCPLCGALAPWDRDRHFYNGLRPLRSYDGPRCVHGEPDVLCTDLAQTDESAAYELKCTLSIPEYPAAILALRYGCAPAVIEWARYCAECRQAFAQRNLPVLRHEMSLLNVAIAEESRVAQRTMLHLGEDIRGLHIAGEALERNARSTETAAGFSRPGFVYLIGHDSALKIGWTERHPSKGRLAHLQTATEKTLEIIGYVVGTVEDERELQRRFADHRIRGEWFHPVQEIVAYFQQEQS